MDKALSDTRSAEDTLINASSRTTELVKVQIVQPDQTRLVLWGLAEWPTAEFDPGMYGEAALLADANTNSRVQTASAERPPQRQSLAQADPV